MKRKILYIIIILFFMSFIITAFLLFSKSLNEKDSFSPSYYNVLSQIEEGNQYVIENDLSDVCSPYRYFHHGCYYYQSNTYLIFSDLQNRNLTHEEIIGLCYKFAHKGGIAYCLKSNNQIQMCHSFAEGNSYLKRVCNLEEGNVIPSKEWGPYSMEDSVLVDSWDTIEPVKYSELV